jgi:hypothetical protein
LSDDEFEPIPDETEVMESAISSQLAASALGPLAQRQESIAQIYVEEANQEVLSHFNSWQEVMNYAKANYLLDTVDAMGMEEFMFPDFRYLLKIDMRLRNSWKQWTRKFLESITKIFERGDGGKRGLLGRR